MDFPFISMYLLCSCGKQIKKMKQGFNLRIVVACCLIVSACNKNILNNPNSANNLFTDSIPGIKNHEPLLLSFSNGNNAAIVNWQVSPNANYTISKVGIYASFNFNKSGVYKIIATANSIQATYIVNVLDSVFIAPDTGFTLQASKLIKVLPYEIDSFTIVNPPSTNGFVWTTSGNISLISSAKSPALFSFGSGKTGSVKVKVGNQIRSRTIWLTDTSLHNPNLDTVPFIFSDKLTITPSVSLDNKGNKLLLLTAQTNYNYNSNTDVVLNLLDSSNQQYTVNYGGVVIAALPNANVKQASCSNIISNMQVGTYPFVVNYGNHTYLGTVELSTSGVFSFGWVKNNEVSIFPLSVQ